MLSDNELLQLSKIKPEKALDKIINTYAGLVYAIVFDKLSLICSKEDIEECVSDVFYEVYRKRETIDLQKGTIKVNKKLFRSIPCFRCVPRLKYI